MSNVNPKVKIPAFRPLSISASKNASPVKSEKGSISALGTEMNEEEKEAACQKLREEIAQLENELGESDPQQVIKEHIRLLHEYNEVKDLTQLANSEGITVKAMHQRFELPMTD